MLKFGMCSPSNQVSDTCGCGFVMITPTENCFGYQKLTTGLIRLKFGQVSSKYSGEH